MAHEIPYAIGEYFSAQTAARSWWRWNVRNDCSLCCYLPFRGCKIIQKIILKKQMTLPNISCLMDHDFKGICFFNQKFDQKSSRVQLSKGSPWPWFGRSWQFSFLIVFQQMLLVKPHKTWLFEMFFGGFLKNWK